MSWETVKANINWSASPAAWGPLPNFGGVFSLSEQTDILEYLRQMYFGSATAAALLERGTSDGREIKLYKTATAPALIPSGPPIGIVGFNLSVLDNAFEFNNKGAFVRFLPSIAIIHELSHAIDGTTDPNNNVPPSEAQLNSPSFDYVGDTVRVENTVAREMGWVNNERGSYDAAMLNTDSRYTLLRQDISYSDGNRVDIVRLGYGSEDNMDVSTRTDNSSDILMGFGGNDIIKSGAGNDYLYGGTGDDTLSPGSGNDFVHGGDTRIIWS